MISSSFSQIPLTLSLGGTSKACRHDISSLPLEIIGQIFSFLNLKDLYPLNGVCKSWKAEVSDIKEKNFEMEEFFETIHRSQMISPSYEAFNMTPFISITKSECDLLSLILGDPLAVTRDNQLACVVPYQNGVDGVSLMIKIARFYKKTMLSSSNYIAHFNNNSLNKVGVRFNSRDNLQIVLENKILNYKIVNRGILRPNTLELVSEPSTIKEHRSDSSLNTSRLTTHYDHKRLYMTHSPKGTTLDSIKVVENDGIEYELPAPYSTSKAFSVRMESLNDHLLVGYNCRHKIKLCLYDLKTRSLVNERDFQDEIEREGEDLDDHNIFDHFFFLANDCLFLRTFNGLMQGVHRVDTKSLEIIDSFYGTLKEGDECIDFKVIDNICILVIKNNEALFLYAFDTKHKKEIRLTLNDKSTYHEASIINSNSLAIKTVRKDRFSFNIAFFCPQSMKILFQTQFPKDKFISLLQTSWPGVKDKGYTVYDRESERFTNLYLSKLTINKLRNSSHFESLKGIVIRLSSKLILNARAIATAAAFHMALSSRQLFFVCLGAGLIFRLVGIRLTFAYYKLLACYALICGFSTYIHHKLS